MKIKKMLLFIVVGFFCNVINTEAKARNIEEWEKCVDKENTIAYDKGLCGALWCNNDSEIQRHCGDRPIDETASMLIGIGVNSYDLVRSKAWKKKFVSITKEKYQAFVDRLYVTSDTTLQGNWIIGQGWMPHAHGDDEAAFAINTTSGKVFAVMLEDHNITYPFGFTNFYDAPPFLKKILKEWIEEDNQ